MPIPVTCPECNYHFLVGDEFAGRPGRCPECAAIIQVPDAEPGAEPRSPPPDRDRRDPDPYQRPQAAEAFDDFPSRVRRRRDDRDRDAEDWDRHERDQRDDYDDRGGGRMGEGRGLTFDAHARAAKWERTASGLRNLMVAVLLMTAAQIVGSTFDLMEPIQPGQQNVLTPKDKALMIGNLVFLVLAMLLWAWGRIGCGRVPYVPARRIALPAGVIAGITAVLGVCAFGLMAGGILMAAQNPAGPGVGLMLLGVCAFLPVLVGFPVAELMGLVSQVKMANGLRDPAFARASRVQLVVALLLTALVMVGMCVLFVFMVGEMQKAQKKQEEELRQQQQNQPPGPKGKGAAPANNAPGGQPPPPEFDWGEHPGVVYAMVISRLLVTLTYAAVSVICFQLGRRAIRREIDHLIGDPHDQERPHDDRY